MLTSNETGRMLMMYSVPLCVNTDCTANFRNTLSRMSDATDWPTVT
jgi:hypothetical protein